MHTIATTMVILGLSAQPALALSANTGVDLSAQADLPLEMNLEADVGANATATIPTSATVTAIGIESGTSATPSATMAETQVDLDAYVSSIIAENATVRDVEATADKIEVNHHISARIFGIIPASVTADTIVHSDGSVEVKLPWYAFAKATIASLQARVAAAVRPTLSVNAAASAELNAGVQADIIAKTVAAIEAEAAVEAAAAVN